MTSLSAARSLPVRGASRAAAALGFGQAKAPSTFATSSALFAVACSSSSSLFARSSSSHQHHRSSSEEHLFASSFDRSSSSHHRRRSSSEEHFFGSSSFACRGFAASPSSVGAGPFSGPEGRHDETKSKPERGGTTNPEASNQAAATFGVLSAAWAGTAAALLFAPEATLSWGFAVSAFPADGGVSALVPLARSLGAAQLVGAAGLWALRDGALDGSAARPSFRRLSLGLAAASATGAVSALVGAEAMSGAGLVSAVAAFGSTVAALARFWSEALPPSTAALDEAAARRRAAGSSALTSAPPNALLMTLAVAALAGGAAYIVAPAATLAPRVGPHRLSVRARRRRRRRHHCRFFEHRRGSRGSLDGPRSSRSCPVAHSRRWARGSGPCGLHHGQGGQRVRWRRCRRSSGPPARVSDGRRRRRARSRSVAALPLRGRNRRCGGSAALGDRDVGRGIGDCCLGCSDAPWGARPGGRELRG